MKKALKNMELIDTITDKGIFGKDVEGTPNIIRNAARAVLFDEDGKIPILFVSKHNFHKLPGGGLEEDEDIMQALARECLEEIGCEIEVTGEVGITKEIRGRDSRLQTSYCYLGKVIKKVQKPKFTEFEREKGFQLKWLSLDDAINKFKNDKPNNYNGKFISIRDFKILEKAKEKFEK